LLGKSQREGEPSVQSAIMKLLPTLLSLLLAAAPLVAQDAPCCQEKAAPAVEAKADCCDEGGQEAAECSPTQKAAMDIFGKIAEVNANKLYNIDYKMAMDMEQMGQPMKMSMDVKMNYGGAKKMRMAIDMTIEMEMMPEPMQMQQEMVMDGEMLYMVMDNPMMGKQAMSVALENEELVGQVSGGLNMGVGGGIDPVAAAKAMGDVMNFTDVKEAESTITLLGTPTDAFSAQMAQGGMEIERVEMVINKKTMFPAKTTMWAVDKEEPMMVMTMSDPSFVKKHPEGLFVFEAPEGITVQDLGAMMSAQGGGAPAGDEELDF